MKKEIRTERLLLRPWKEADLVPFATMSADPRVMEHFPSLLTKEESDLIARRILKRMEEKGWGFFAVSVPDVSDFIGFIGLSEVKFDASFTPAVEVGWRLAHDFWGKGYATEGAKAALKFGFEEIALNEIVSFTAVQNSRSRKVMEKIGLSYIDDFEHPMLPEGDPIRPHVLYRIKKNEWMQAQ